MAALAGAAANQKKDKQRNGRDEEHHGQWRASRHRRKLGTAAHQADDQAHEKAAKAEEQGQEQKQAEKKPPLTQAKSSSGAKKRGVSRAR